MPYTPTLNAAMTIDLPGERSRGIVRKLVDRNTIMIELAIEPTSKQHTYKFGQIIPCRRTDTISGEIWEAVDPIQIKLAQLEREQQRQREARPVPKKDSKGNGLSGKTKVPRGVLATKPKMRKGSARAR